MYVPVGDITDFLDGDDFYSSMAENFAAGDGFRDRYAAAAAAGVIGAKTQGAIEAATDALNASRAGADGGAGLGMLDDYRVQSALGTGIKGLFNQGGGDLFDETSTSDLSIWETDPAQIDLLHNGGIDYGYI